MGQIVFAIVDRPDAVPRRHIIITEQLRKRQVGDVFVEEVSDYVEPNPNTGIYAWSSAHEFSDARVAAVIGKMRRENVAGKPPRIIGPVFERVEDRSEKVEAMLKDALENNVEGIITEEKPENIDTMYQWAQVLVQAYRPKTLEERATQAESKLAAEHARREEEFAGYEARIAELEAAAVQGAPTDPPAGDGK